MKDSIIIRLLYNTIFGRFLLKLLVNPKISRASARFLSSSFSRCLVPFFVQKNRIDLSCYEVPERGYLSFNDFFTRKKHEIYIDYGSGKPISPCDGLLTVSEITEDAFFSIKHIKYCLSELLKSDVLAEEYCGGIAFIFRLTPAHYHRYIWSVSGMLCETRHISGILHSVQPICHEKTKVFVENTREYAIVENDSVGRVLQMEIGALLVGRISNHKLDRYQMVCAGQEKGFFEYGGSSIVMLVKDKIELAEEIRNRVCTGNEIPVLMGEKLIK